MASILIVDDEPGVRSSLSGVLRDEGFDVEAAASGEECLERALRAAYDVIVLDVWLPGVDGLVTLQRLRERKVDSQVVMISGHGNIESAVRATKLGAFDFIEKPLSLDKTIFVVRNALRQRQLETENRALRAHVDRRLVMVGESHEIRQLREQIAMAAPTNGRVLIYGENGTGKELVARSVHALSRRRSGPFIEVNCAAIPEELIESELFGHVKGAFTGATDRHTGRFELADGGTLFLDEVSELPLDTQVKLLRVLQEREFEPVGSTKTQKVDVRVIAATNRHLEDVVAKGTFRSDLYYRLSVFPLEVPPLRERRGDIAELARHFIERLARKVGSSVRALGADARQRLEAHTWPGNVRELQNTIERALISSPGTELVIDWPLGGRRPGVEVAAAVPAPNAATAANGGGGSSEATTLVEVERQHIIAVLKRTAGTIEGPRGAAKLLDMKPSTMRYRIKKLGIRKLDYLS
jgi:two-component system nitrogen regulation response regulator NtrX